MMKDLANHPLLKMDSMNEWQSIIKDEIIWMQENKTPYAWVPGHTGTIESYKHKGPIGRSRNIFKESFGSYCCGATGELFLRSWKRWMVGFESDDISGDQMFNLLRYYFFRRTDLGKKYLEGAASGLNYLYDLCDWLDVGYSQDPDEMEFGSFVQMDFSDGKGLKGHSAIFLSNGYVENRPVMYVWSSNKNYSNKSEYTSSQYDGHGFDFFYTDIADRKFYGAWIAL